MDLDTILNFLNMENEKTMRIPAHKDIGERLSSSGVVGRNRLGDGVMRTFTNSIADREHSGTTLVIAWEQACEDANKGVDPKLDIALTHLLNAYLFDRVIDAVVPDPEIAHDAKEELQFLEEIRS